MRLRAGAIRAAIGMAFAGCEGTQSALDPHGEAARRISELFWQMTVGSLVVWLLVLGVAVYAVYRTPAADADLTRTNRLLIVGGGVVFPTVVLAGLLSYGLAMIPPLTAAAPPGSQRVAVIGEQYWWRVRYETARGEPIELANEVRMPVGVHTQFVLTSPDVIHSFWIPALGGKVDMIPGRTTQLALRPERTGVLHGACAEYCGTSHALMRLSVQVLEPAQFAAWLAQQAEPARAPAGELAGQGAELFVQHGCGACHSVRGTSARGAIGPDLTHVGSRLSLGAGTLPNDVSAFARFVGQLDRVKPGTSMPHFGMLSAAQLAALGAYLEGLQ